MCGLDASARFDEGGGLKGGEREKLGEVIPGEDGAPMLPPIPHDNRPFLLDVSGFLSPRDEPEFHCIEM